MSLEGLLIKEVPFPYFILDEDLSIQEKSIQAEETLQDKKTFIELIDYRHQDTLCTFLQNPLSEGFKEALLYEKNSYPYYYHVYKAKDQSSNIHVYCLRAKSELTEISDMLLTVENKILTFNQNLIEKKNYLEKTVEEMKNAVNYSDQQNHIRNLAASIAHEIRNPLTTVKGFLQLLKPYLQEIGKVHYADVALEEINRANDIIYEFLNSTKPHSTSIHEISVNKLIKDIVMLYESEAILRNIQIFTTFSRDETIISIDPNQLKQVIINLIKNAMEAIDESSHVERVIHISTLTDSKNICIKIADNGCGMAKDTIDKLFTPFFSTKEKGTGIGLSVCKKIIENHGGSIQLESKIGKGTTFTIHFPIFLPTFTNCDL